MPITYKVLDDGHFLCATASAPLSADDFVEYEMAHAADERIKPPVSELFEIKHDSCKDISKEEFLEVLERRNEMLKKPTPHRLAIVIHYADSHAWDLAKFYEGMVLLHNPESVVLFGDIQLARIWLGVEEVQVE